MKTPPVKLLVISVLFFCCLYVYQQDSQPLQTYKPRRSRPNGTVTVFDPNNEYSPWLLSTCPEFKSWCHFTNDSSRYPAADAVLQQARQPLFNSSYRHPDHIYVWQTRESPVHINAELPPHFINWTMTYQFDSDVWHPYGQLEKAGPFEVDLEKIWSSKQRDAAWVGSNCVTDNRRKEMIELLRDKGLQTDIWGGCGKPLPSCRRYSSGECRIKAMRPYKFYLAIENSNCEDYVTEKFWGSLSDFEAVPIVVKRAYYQSYGVPDSAFIAIEDFSNVEELVSYLNTLRNNKTAYLEYHGWRKQYRVLSQSANSGYCKLCSSLRHRPDHPPKSYKDLSQWYSPSYRCEQRLLDKYLGRTFSDRLRCYFNSLRIWSYHWNCR